jgi:2-polyprenyl-6-hydroxyphenyl methylase/3-demethylubiquinone-9 3-methyltransferase
MKIASTRPRNDLGQYDDLVGEWWQPFGAFAMLHGIAEARGRLIPPAARPGAVLVDLGCGGGLLAPHLSGKGYRHFGVDLSASALRQAVGQGVRAVRGDACALPLANEVADVVSAGEILEHVADLPGTVGEACRILRPGGLVVLDTLAATAAARFVAVTVGERIPGGAPPGIHDPELFVNRTWLVEEFARHGVELVLRGIRPSIRSMAAWRLRRIPHPQLVSTRSTAVLFQGRGLKHAC